MTHVHRLINRQNHRLVLSDVILKVEELAIIIQDAIFPILHDRAAQQFNAGQRLVFRPVTIGKRGIQIDKKRLAGQKSGSVQFNGGI